MRSDNATRFVDAFHGIETELRRRTRSGADVRFYRLVDLAIGKDAVVARHQVDLKEWADLRNAIVHEGTRSHIARPYAGTVREIERIAGLLLKPPAIRRVLGPQRVQIAQSDSPVSSAIRAMHRHRFSQMPVYSGDNLIGLLTTETFARFVAAKAHRYRAPSLQTPVADVLPHLEDPQHFEVVARTASAPEALALFDHYEAEGKYLDAIIMTRTGSRSEPPIGIVTIFDVPKLQAAI